MRPKRKDEKKQEEEVDFSTLPPWSALVLVMEWHPYVSDLKALFPTSQFFPISREEIIQYSRDKGTILPETTDSMLTPEILGRALRDKLLNLDVQGRKAKKEMIQKYELAEKQRAEAIEKGQIPLENPIPPFNPNKPDQIYLLSGYPKSQAEAEYMGKFGHCVHLYMHVKPEYTELKAQHQKLLEEYYLKANLGEAGPEPQELSLPETWKFLQNAMWTSPKNSPLRNLMICTMEFQQNKPEELEEVKEEEKEKKSIKKKGRKGDDKRKEELKKLEEIKKKEEAKKIEEAKRAEEAKKKEEERKKLEELKKKEESKKKPTKEEAKLKKDEEMKAEEKLDQLDNGPPDPKKVFILEVLQQISSLSLLFIKYSNWKEASQLHPLFPSFSSEIEPVSDIEKISPQATPEPYKLISDLPSLDSAPKPWDFRVIAKLLNSNDELCACPEYFLASMMQAIGYSQDYISQSYTKSEEIFKEFKRKVTANMKSFNEVTEEKIVDDRNEADVTARNLRFDLGFRISEVENTILENLVVPGIDRRLMPELPEKPFGPRFAEKCEIYPFSSFPIPEFDRMLLLQHIENGLRERTGEQWDLSTRGYSERLSTNLLKQVISRVMANDPEVVPIYYPREDSLVLVLSYLIPSTGAKTFSWEGKWRVRPNFQQWLKYFHGEMPVMDFYDIDEGKVGPIMERSKVAFANDGSILTVKEFAVGPREINENQRDEQYSSKFMSYISKNNIRFGPRNNEIWLYFPDKSRAVCEKGSFTLTQMGLTIRFQNGEVLQDLASMALRCELGGEAEINRAITGKGTVIRYLSESIQILFANGNVSVHQEGVWISTNNKGFRQKRTENKAYEIDPIPCTEITDPYSFIKTMMRSDGVTVISYPDGKTIAEHADGTKIYQENQEVTIESPGYAPVKLTQFQSVTYLKDGSTVVNSSEQISFEGSDKKKIIIKDDSFQFVTGETVENWGGMGNDDIQAEVFFGSFQKNSIWFRDSEENSNFFEISDREIRSEIVGLNVVAVKPRIFVIENHGEGYELLDDCQMQSISLRTPTSPRVFTEGDLEYHCYFSSISTSLLEKGHLQGSFLGDYSYTPAFSALKPQIIHEPPKPPHFFTLRTFIKHPILTLEKKEKFHSDLENYQQWKALQITNRSEFGVEDLRDLRTQREEFQIKRKIFTFRQNKAFQEKLTFESFRKRILRLISNQIQAEKDELDKKTEEINIRKRQATLIQPAEVFRKEVKVRQKVEKIQPEVPEQAYRAGGFLNYFISKEGKSFLQENPPISPVKEVSIKPLSEVNPEELQPEEVKYFDSMKNSLTNAVVSPQNNTKSLESENPFIALVPETRSKQKYQAKPVVLKPVTKPSVFAEVDRLQQLREQAEKDAAEEYSLIKSKNFDVYGNPRQDKLTVNALRTSSPESTPNAKFILTESATDRRGRTVSQSNRVHIKAPTVQEMRREGTHSVLHKALMKKQSYKEMIDTQNMMISAYTNDPLKRSLQIIPASLRYGVVKAGEVYEMTVLLKNEDSQLLRFIVRQPPRKDIKILFKPAPIAPGMFTKLTAEICVKNPEKFESEFEVASKTEIFRIPVFVNALSSEEYEKINEESVRLHGRSILKPTVKAKGGNSSIIRWGESTSSDANLPKLPRIGN